MNWADLLMRVWAIDALKCPFCGGKMRVIAVIHDPDAVTAILAAFNSDKWSIPVTGPPGHVTPREPSRPDSPANIDNVDDADEGRPTPRDMTQTVALASSSPTRRSRTPSLTRPDQPPCSAQTTCAPQFSYSQTTFVFPTHGGLHEYVARQDAYLLFEDGPTTDVHLRWATCYDAADQAGQSRLWGGIWPDGRRTRRGCRGRLRRHRRRARREGADKRFDSWGGHQDVVVGEERAAQPIGGLALEDVGLGGAGQHEEVDAVEDGVVLERIDGAERDAERRGRGRRDLELERQAVM